LHPEWLQAYDPQVPKMGEKPANRPFQQKQAIERRTLVNGLTPLKLGRVMVAAVAIVAVAAVGVSQSPLPQGWGAENSPDPNSGFPLQNPAQLSGSDVAIAATAQIPGSSPRPAARETAFERAGAAGEMIGFSHYDASGTQTITLVHAGKSWMAVYHVDRSGTIRLVSSRPIDADFSLQLNATSPLPEEIREIGRR